MPEYKCKKCGYTTEYKSHYNNHLNKINPCFPKKNKQDHNDSSSDDEKKPKQKISSENNNRHNCSVCDVSFARKDALVRHFKSVTHTNNIKKNNIKITNNGDNNQNTINIDNSMHITNNITIISPAIHDYLHNSINDLSLFEQYLIFSYNITVNCTPYTTLLDYLNFNPNKPEYHNILYKNLNKNFLDIHDGDDWIIGNSNLIEKLIANQRTLLCSIFNKFRIFLGRRSHIFGIKHLYNGLYCDEDYIQTNKKFKKYIEDNNNLKEHKKVGDDLKIHIYNKSKTKKPLTYTNENIPQNRDHPIWKSLSKTFDWNETVSFITEMESLGINFNSNLEVIRYTLEDVIKLKKYKSKKYDTFFKKLFDRLSFFINMHLRVQDVLEDDYNKNGNETTSEDNEIDKFYDFYKEYGDRIFQNAAYLKRQETMHDPVEIMRNSTTSKPKKKTVNRDDHKNYSTKVRYHGSYRIGRDYDTTESD
jgi:hypothetical protein